MPRRARPSVPIVYTPPLRAPLLVHIREGETESSLAVQVHERMRLEADVGVPGAVGGELRVREYRSGLSSVPLFDVRLPSNDQWEALMGLMLAAVNAVGDAEEIESTINAPAGEGVRFVLDIEIPGTEGRELRLREYRRGRPARQLLAVRFLRNDEWDGFRGIVVGACNQRERLLSAAAGANLMTGEVDA